MTKVERWQFAYHRPADAPGANVNRPRPAAFVVQMHDAPKKAYIARAVAISRGWNPGPVIRVAIPLAVPEPIVKEAP